MDEESVYRLVPVEMEQPPKPPLYRSIHPGAVSPKQVPCSNLGIKNVRAAATMGPGSGEVFVSPNKFLLSHEKEPVLPKPGKPSTQKMKLKEDVPKRSEAPVMGLQSGKNFLLENKKEAVTAVPKYSKQQELCYLDKPWFGSVPPYLQKRMREIQAQREEQLHQGSEEDPNVVQTLQGDDLAALVKHLKLKWQSLNEAYQKLPCVLDTPSKKRRKEEMEAHLVEIEHDIHTLQKAQVVHITAN